MTAFQIESTAEAAHLRLSFDVTIEQARDLHKVLVSAVTPNRPLHVDPSALTRIDVAALQVVLAAARTAGSARLTAPSSVWTAALVRHGIADPFVQP